MPTITSHYPTTIPDLYMESLAVSQIQSHDHLSSGGKRNTRNRGEKAGGGKTSDGFPRAAQDTDVGAGTERSLDGA